MAVETPYPNDLKQWIKKRGYRLYEVADHIKVSTRILTDYCAGRLPVPHDKLQAIAELIGCPVEVLTALDERRLVQYQRGQSLPVFRGDDMDKKRRELLCLLSVASTALVLPVIDWERIEAALAHPRLVDEKVVVNLGAVNAHYWSIYRAAGSKGSVLDGALGHLKTLVQFLQGSYAGPVHVRLCAVASDLAQLVGEIFFDLHDYSSAQAAYTFAVAAAKEAGAYDLWACALTRNSYLPIYDEEYGAALPLVTEARRVVAHGDSQLVTRYWVESVAAETFAGLHQGDACRAALDGTTGVLGARVEDSPAWLRFDGSRLSALRGTCFVRLGDAQAAYAPLEEALTVVPGSVRRRGMVLTDLGQAALLQGNIDRACTYGKEAAAIAVKSSSAMLKEGLVKLRGRLEPYSGARSVVELDAVLYQLN